MMMIGEILITIVFNLKKDRVHCEQLQEEVRRPMKKAARDAHAAMATTDTTPKFPLSVLCDSH